jgi:hypothetical protein
MCGGGVGCRPGCNVPFVFLADYERVWCGVGFVRKVKGMGRTRKLSVEFSLAYTHYTDGRKGEVNKLNRNVREMVSSG